MKIWEKIIQYIQLFNDWFNKLSAGEKQRFALACTGVFVLLLALAVVISTAGKDKVVVPGSPERGLIVSPIPAGELFLPEEPDFVPGVILSRDRRSSWTEEDAEEYWQDPLRFGEEHWREKIENTVNELLERVP